MLYLSHKNIVMFQFDKKCFFLSVILFALLSYIALFVHDQFVRPFLGDVIVVVWLYFSLKCLLTMKPSKLAFVVLLLAYAIETAQYFHFVTLLGLEHIRAARIILGATFDWLDMLAYTIGWACVVIIESPWTRLMKLARKNEGMCIDK